MQVRKPMCVSLNIEDIELMRSYAKEHRKKFTSLVEGLIKGDFLWSDIENNVDPLPKEEREIN